MLRVLAEEIKSAAFHHLRVLPLLKLLLFGEEFKSRINFDFVHANIAMECANNEDWLTFDVLFNAD